MTEYGRYETTIGNPGDTITDIIRSFRGIIGRISIHDEDDVARGRCAMKAWGLLDKVERELALMEKEPDSGGLKHSAQRAVHHALEAGGFLCSLLIIDHGAAIDARSESLIGALKGGTARTMIERDIALAEQCLAHPDWPKDSGRIRRAVCTVAGLGYETGRKAITRGLRAKK